MDYPLRSGQARIDFHTARGRENPGEDSYIADEGWSTLAHLVVAAVSAIPFTLRGYPRDLTSLKDLVLGSHQFAYPTTHHTRCTACGYAGV